MQVGYTSASFIGPVAGSLTVAIIVGIAAAAGFVIFKKRKARELEKIKTHMSDTSRRKTLAQGVVRSRRHLADTMRVLSINKLLTGVR